MQQIDKKKAAIEEVRQLYDNGHAPDEISRITGHTLRTVTNYLKE